MDEGFGAQGSQPPPPPTAGASGGEQQSQTDPVCSPSSPGLALGRDRLVVVVVVVFVVVVMGLL